MAGQDSEVLLPDGINLPRDIPFLVVWVGPLHSHPSRGHERDPIVEIVFQEIETEKSLGWASVKNIVAKSPPRTEWLPLLFLVHARVGTIWKNKRNIGTIRFTVRSFLGVIDPTDWAFESGQTTLEALYGIKGQSWLPSLIDQDMHWPVPSSIFYRSNFVRLQVKPTDKLPEPSSTVVPCTAIFHSIFFISDRLSQHILFGDFEGEKNRLYDPEKTTIDRNTGKIHLVVHPDMLAQDEWAIAMLLSNPRGIPSMRVIRNSSLHHTFDKSFELRAHLPFAGKFRCTLRGIELQGVNSQTTFIGLDIVDLKTEIFIKELTVPREHETNKSEDHQDLPPHPPNKHEQAPAPSIPNSQDLNPEFRGGSLRNQRSARFRSKKYRSAYFVQGNIKKERIYQSKPRPKANHKRSPKDAHPRFSTNPRGMSDTGVPRADGSAQTQIMPVITDELNADGGVYAERLGLILSDLSDRGYRIAPCYWDECITTGHAQHLNFPPSETGSHITSIRSADGVQRPRRIFVYKISNQACSDSVYLFDFERTQRGEISKWIVIIRGQRQDDKFLPFTENEMWEFLIDYVQKNADLSKIQNYSIRKVLDQEQTEESSQEQIAFGLSDAEAWCFRHLPNFIQALREKIPHQKTRPDHMSQPHEHLAEKNG